MDIGVGLPTTVPGADGRALVDCARRADRLGFSTLAVIDRLVYDSYDSIVALAAAAAATERITLATTVLLAAYRRGLAELGKQLASVDRISGGRLVLGVAAGGREDDFAATGADYRTRGRRLDQILDTLGTNLAIGPKPAQHRIPIWVGGHSPAALRRAATHADGWIAPGGSAARYPELVRHATTVFADAGRTRPLRLIAIAYVALGERREAGAAYLVDYYSHIGPKARYLAGAAIADAVQLRETVAGYAAAGCDELLLFPCTADPAHLDGIAAAALP